MLYGFLKQLKAVHYAQIAWFDLCAQDEQVLDFNDTTPHIVPPDTTQTSAPDRLCAA